MFIFEMFLKNKMGCLKLSYKEKNYTGLKVVYSSLYENENSCAGAYRYGFNGKEKDDEIKGGGNSYDFGARIYDSRLGRFLSVDPRTNDFPFMTPYCYAANNPIRLTDEDGEGPGDPFRLIFWGGAKKDGDNGAFRAASKNVAGDYGGVPKENIMQVISAREIVTKINAQKNNSIQSVDIFTHGGTNALYVNNGNGTYAGNTSLYRSSWAKLLKSGGGTLISGGSAVIDEIDFNKFTDNAKIELHGCQTADGNADDDNIAADFSTRLFNAGKKNAVVIGHTTPANPNIDGDETTDKGQDYRHGERAVYHNGSLLFTTKEQGRLGGKVIGSYLKAKEKAGDKYDGSKEVYTKKKK
jgi:RHS repeat-associated protein